MRAGGCAVGGLARKKGGVGRGKWVRGHRANNGREIGRKEMGEIGGSEKPQYRQTQATKSNGVPTVYTFWQQAKTVRDGRGEVERKEGKIQKYGQGKQPVPEHTVMAAERASLVTIIPGKTVYGK
jgi:hypothetical protein